MCSEPRSLALFRAEESALARTGHIGSFVALEALLFHKHGIAHKLTLALEGQLAQGVVLFYLMLQAHEEVFVVSNATRHNNFYSDLPRVVLLELLLLRAFAHAFADILNLVCI